VSQEARTPPNTVEVIDRVHGYNRYTSSTYYKHLLDIKPLDPPTHAVRRAGLTNMFSLPAN
jgi:hypothetical protein